MPKRPTIRERLENSGDELLDVLRGSERPTQPSPALAQRVAAKADKPTKQQARKTASQEDSKATPNRTKVTFYLDPDDVTLLEGERRKRLEAGARRSDVDLSSLVREAIQGSYGKGRK